MTTVVGVRKNGRVAIAADSQSTQGNVIIPGEHKSSPSKLVRIGKAYVGVVGASANGCVVRSLARRYPEKFQLGSAEEVFESLRGLQPILEDEYFVRTDEDDRDQEYDSSQLYGMLISPGGLFYFGTYRGVAEIEQFWATDSGMEFAIGAMETLYGTKLDAKGIAERAVHVACKFDDGTGPPVASHSLKLD